MPAQMLHVVRACLPMAHNRVLEWSVISRHRYVATYAMPFSGLSSLYRAAVCAIVIGSVLVPFNALLSYSSSLVF